ncbi:MAG: MOSC N-terminal beta barrel domain-containing protein [Pseudomonadota bacterium]|nr:MOSC N-terminal beta barrel domain-containing protein [Pseudomonadota bacterium]
MAKLSQLILYPVKSCAGLSVPAATVTRAGLALDNVRDREWMVVGDDDQFLTQREHPRMALIAPQLHADTLVLHAPGAAPLALALAHPPAALVRTRAVGLWDDRVLADDCGDGAAAWFSAVLGVRCRLVRFGAAAARQTSGTWTGGVPAPTLFADGYPLLLIGAASLEDLNDKLRACGRPALPMDRFRPNLVIDGLDAFEEDYLDTVRCGAALLKPVKPCPRCPIPSIDQATGVAGADPLDILRGYRRKAQLDDAVCFGMNCIVVTGAGERLVVGQQVEATLAF